MDLCTAHVLVQHETSDFGEKTARNSIVVGFDVGRDVGVPNFKGCSFTFSLGRQGVVPVALAQPAANDIGALRCGNSGWSLSGVASCRFSDWTRALLAQNNSGVQVDATIRVDVDRGQVGIDTETALVVD